MRYNKYSNKKTVVVVNGKEIKFDSKKEAKRYGELRLLERAKKIKKLELQPKFEIVPKVKHGDFRAMSARHYIADFMYEDLNGDIIVEDVKGYKTDMYRLKKQIFLSKYGDKVKFIET